MLLQVQRRICSRIQYSSTCCSRTTIVIHQHHSLCINLSIVLTQSNDCPCQSESSKNLTCEFILYSFPGKREREREDYVNQVSLSFPVMHFDREPRKSMTSIKRGSFTNPCYFCCLVALCPSRLLSFNCSLWHVYENKQHCMSDV